MAVIEIRIIDMADTDRIDLGTPGSAKPIAFDAQQMTGAPDQWVVVARAAQSAAPVARRASTPRPKMFSMDYTGWHARLAGRTRAA